MLQPPSSLFLTAFFLYCSTLLLANLPRIVAVKCLNCRTLEEQLICDDPCEGDICALWSFREMSTDHVVQGCLSGPDLREFELRMGCRRNRVDSLLCICNSTDYCNSDEQTVAQAHPSEQPMMPTEIRCQSRTSASFIRRQMVKPLKHSCHSDICFFTQSNSTAIPADDPLGLPPSMESTTSRNCGPQLEFNFDILLGPVWPGNGLHSEACYQLETGRDRLVGCSCSNNDCNQQMPYPIVMDGKKPVVKCHLGVKPSPLTNLSRQPAIARPHCIGHFCFVQKETFHGYGDHWTSGCLSANESAARAKLKPGYRNILGVEQWLCAEDFCNGQLLRTHNGDGNGSPRRHTDGMTVDGPVGIGRGKTAAKAEGGRVQAQKQALAKKRKEIAAHELCSSAVWRSGVTGNVHLIIAAFCLIWLYIF